MKIILPSKSGDEPEAPRSKLGFRFNKRDTSSARATSNVKVAQDLTKANSTEPSRIEIKLLVLGDHIGQLGLKNALLNVYTRQRTDLDEVFTYDETNVNITIDALHIQYRLCTTAGMENFDRIRQGMYPITKVVLMLFHYNDRSSFDNATNMWLDEIREHLPNVPVVLVGVKDESIPVPDEPGSIVLPHEAMNTAKENGFDVFVECSMQNLPSVNNAFNHALLSALLSDKNCKESAENAYPEYSQLNNEFAITYFNTFKSKVFQPLSYVEQKSRKNPKPAQTASSAEPVARPSRFGGLFKKHKDTNREEPQIRPSSSQHSSANNSVVSTPQLSESNANSAAADDDALLALAHLSIPTKRNSKYNPAQLKVSEPSLTVQNAPSGLAKTVTPLFPIIYIKLRVVGNEIGKNSLIDSLLNTYTNQKIDLKSNTKFNSCDVDLAVGNQQLVCQLDSTIGREEVHRDILLSYSPSDVILLVFHYNLKESFDSIFEDCLPLIKRSLPKVPVVLLGVKDDYIPAPPNNGLIIDQSHAMKIAKKNNIDVFVECSATNLASVIAAFNQALVCALLSNEHNRQLGEKTYQLNWDDKSQFSCIYINKFDSMVFDVPTDFTGISRASSLSSATRDTDTLLSPRGRSPGLFSKHESGSPEQAMPEASSDLAESYSEENDSKVISDAVLN